MAFLINSYIYGGAAPETELPATAIARLNFQSGFYYAGGTEQALTLLLGGGFQSGQVSASGMLVTFGNANRPTAIGDFSTDLKTALAAGCTIIMECNFINPPFGVLIVFLDDVSYNAADHWVLAKIDSNNVLDAIYVEDQGAIGFDGTLETVQDAGVYTIGVTFNRNLGGSVYQYASSVNGSTASTQTTTSLPFSPYTKIAIGDDGNSRTLDNVYIRSITLYPAKTTAELATLTTP